MDKWPGRKNGGNHCHRTEYRKKNENKKLIKPKRDLQDNIKHINIHIIGVPEEEIERKEKIFEVIIA